MAECWLIDQSGCVLAHSHSHANTEPNDDDDGGETNPLQFLPIQTLQQWFIHERLPRIRALRTRSGSALLVDSVLPLISA